MDQKNKIPNDKKNLGTVEDYEKEQQKEEKKKLNNITKFLIWSKHYNGMVKLQLILIFFIPFAFILIMMAYSANERNINELIGDIYNQRESLKLIQVYLSDFYIGYVNLFNFGFLLGFLDIDNFSKGVVNLYMIFLENKNMVINKYNISEDYYLFIIQIITQLILYVFSIVFYYIIPNYIFQKKYPEFWKKQMSLFEQKTR